MTAPHDGHWEDWRWQLRAAATTLEDARRLCGDAGATGDPQGADQAAARFPMLATPYYLSLLERWAPDDPIYRQIIPDEAELLTLPDELDDPIGDQGPHLLAPPNPAITHRRPDRVLLHVTRGCAVHCRHCFRGSPRRRASAATASDLEAALVYVERTAGIREAILTGGDPLLLEDDRLLALLQRLARVDHLRLLRIHTRFPVVNPWRVTEALVEKLAGLARPVRIVTQFNHPRELTPEARGAAARLVDGGIPVLNQSVLLAGVNDCEGVNDREGVLEELLWGLVEARIQPYYLHLGDKAPGTGHLRTSVECGARLLRTLRARLPGYAVPRLMLEVPGGAGKIPVDPAFLRFGKEGVYEVMDPMGRTHRYAESPSMRDD